MNPIADDLAGSVALPDRCERIMKDAHVLLRQSDVLISHRLRLLREAMTLTKDVTAAGRRFTDDAASV
jgi:hypothetical protein